MDREEVLADLVYDAANGLAEAALNAGEGRQFLLDNGWTETEISESLRG